MALADFKEVLERNEKFVPAYERKAEVNWWSKYRAILITEG